jgi:predicted RNase H-like HicB family nuclease
MNDDRIDIFLRDQDGGDIADIPGLKACPAFAKTPGESLTGVPTAKDAWLAAARAKGRPVPLPICRRIATGAA